MLIRIPEFISKAQVAECRALLESADWINGSVTAGHQAALAKNNLQLPEDSSVARQLGGLFWRRSGNLRKFLPQDYPIKFILPCLTVIRVAGSLTIMSTTLYVALLVPRLKSVPMYR